MILLLRPENIPWDYTHQWKNQPKAVSVTVIQQNWNPSMCLDFILVMVPKEVIAPVKGASSLWAGQTMPCWPHAPPFQHRGFASLHFLRYFMELPGTWEVASELHKWSVIMMEVEFEYSKESIQTSISEFSAHGSLYRHLWATFRRLHLSAERSQTESLLSAATRSL